MAFLLSSILGEGSRYWLHSKVYIERRACVACVHFWKQFLLRSGSRSLSINPTFIAKVAATSFKFNARKKPCNFRAFDGNVGRVLPVRTAVNSFRQWNYLRELHFHEIGEFYRIIPSCVEQLYELLSHKELVAATRIASSIIVAPRAYEALDLPKIGGDSFARNSFPISSNSVMVIENLEKDTRNRIFHSWIRV